MKRSNRRQPTCKPASGPWRRDDAAAALAVDALRDDMALKHAPLFEFDDLQVFGFRVEMARLGVGLPLSWRSLTCEIWKSTSLSRFRSLNLPSGIPLSWMDVVVNRVVRVFQRGDAVTVASSVETSKSYESRSSASSRRV